MAFKKSLSLLGFLLLLSLLFLLYDHNNHNSKNYEYDDNLKVGHHREILEISNSNNQLFDFTPFKRFHRKHVPVRPEPEIDPLYGAEKRLVPTGPNPLHH